MGVRAAAPLVALVVALSGCTSTGGTVSTPSSSRPPFQTAPPLPGGSGTPGTTGAVPPQRWAAILADLESRGVPTEDVTVVTARSVTWNDGALGCPKPGVSYTQALVNGMQVVVTAGGTRYDYRFGTGDRPKLCQR